MLIDPDTEDMIAYIAWCDDTVIALEVNKKYRHRGIASALLNYSGVTKLTVSKKNINAISLYKKLGFVITDENSRIYFMQKYLNEQFNINDLDFNDDESRYDANIFNKNTVNPYDVLDRIHNKEKINAFEIEQLNQLTAAAKVNDRFELRKIIEYYSNDYPNDSLNWLDVSCITNMNYVFYINDYVKN